MAAAALGVGLAGYELANSISQGINGKGIFENVVSGVTSLFCFFFRDTATNIQCFVFNKQTEYPLFKASASTSLAHAKFEFIIHGHPPNLSGVPHPIFDYVIKENVLENKYVLEKVNNINPDAISSQMHTDVPIYVMFALVIKRNLGTAPQLRPTTVPDFPPGMVSNPPAGDLGNILWANVVKLQNSSASYRFGFPGRGWQNGAYPCPGVLNYGDSIELATMAYTDPTNPLGSQIGEINADHSQAEIIGMFSAQSSRTLLENKQRKAEVIQNQQ